MSPSAQNLYMRLLDFCASFHKASLSFASPSRYSFVELQLNFAMDLYPFYPPLVSILRPRLEGFMMGKIATLRCCLNIANEFTRLHHLVHINDVVPTIFHHISPRILSRVYLPSILGTTSIPYGTYFVMTT